MVNWRDIEEKWQTAWRDAKIFEANPDNRPKLYLTVAYPYVSGPMHIGHARTYTVPDVIARYKRMRGFNVLFPMAYHFTGTPIVGAARRVAKGDQSFIRLLTEFYKIPGDIIDDFKNPYFFATYFAREDPSSYRRGMEELGLSIDWRREFTTVDPHYKKFITWQYHKLWNAGLIVKGKHPVKWCSSCGNPVTDHDLLEGEGAEILEFTLLKYKMDDYVFPAATLRPETVFGVTNIWLNPSAKYVVAEVDGEKWIVSEEAVGKLKEQGYRIGKTEPFSIDFTKKVEVPLTHAKVPILPAKFVDPGNATGVVGSVPAHAPYDYIALLELQKNPKSLETFGLSEEDILKLKPISLIQVEGYGEFPAIDAVERLKIRSQTDRKLEEATAEVYKAEFAKGRMREWVPGYGGLPVSEAKIRVKENMIKNGEAAVMYEFSAMPVTCRCGAKVVVKVVEDQWFIDYGNEEWKEKVREWLPKMQLIPPESRTQFEHVLEWLHEWPCTRKIGMGTPAPWNPEWIIESLSDSTIYMAYYTIAHLIKTIPPEKLTDEIFDYIFYGRGDADKIS
ncbi:MAG: leucine--tRNA ligase, partial [Candidatus Hadarchaeales archaeon]